MFSNQLVKLFQKTPSNSSWQNVFFCMNRCGNSGHRNTFSFTGRLECYCFFGKINSKNMLKQIFCFPFKTKYD